VCFGQALTRRADQGDPRERWDRDMAERRAAEEDAWRGRVDPWHIADWAESRRLGALKRIEGERLLTRRRWVEGRLADSVESHLPFIYARAFLFALDAIVKVLGVLAESPVRSAAADALADLDERHAGSSARPELGSARRGPRAWTGAQRQAA
jgi:hypothetical protein